MKTTALHSELTFGNLFSDSGVASAPKSTNVYHEPRVSILEKWRVDLQGYLACKKPPPRRTLQ